MRIRKKKNLLPRMERCGAYQIKDPYERKGRWHDLMPEAKEIRVERSRTLLKDTGQIHFKTDNDPLFEWSIEEIPQFGFTLSEVTRDLHANGQCGVMTDYEAKFYAEGKNINRCVATMQPWEEPEEEDTPKEAAETAE